MTYRDWETFWCGVMLALILGSGMTAVCQAKGWDLFTAFVVCWLLSYVQSCRKRGL